MARPAADEFAFRLYERALHPELFAVRATARAERPWYAATLCLCDAGHLVEFRAGGRTLTEVLAPRDFELPDRGKRVGRRLVGARLEDVRFDRDAAAPAVRYQAGHQAETLAADVFAHVTEELLADAAATLRAADGEAHEPVAASAVPGQTARAGAAAYRFASAGRLAGDSVGLIRVEAEADSLLVHATHTFADTRTVVRTQSLFELD